MKRDWDVIREVLLEIEADNNGKSTYGDDKYPIKTGHAFLLRDAGFIQAVDASTLTGPALIHPTLTWQGHELLDTIRSKPVWEKIKSTAEEKGINLTFDAVIALGKVAVTWVVAQAMS
ncbi:MAG: DUF2513 domain-containing protein [Steroidobacteraceae bacterium]